MHLNKDKALIFKMNHIYTYKFLSAKIVSVKTADAEYLNQHTA